MRKGGFLLGACVVLAWLGMYVHNRADLPGLTFRSPENVGPAAVWVLCFSLRLAFARHRWAAAPLAAWGLLNLVGGFLSVLPMPFWPYVPEQSLRHYAFHVLYAAAQVPLLVMARAELRRARHIP
jgi:hypothetical protein